MTSFLIVQHEDNCPADYFGQWWREAGVDQHVVFGPRDAVPAELGEHDALVVLGGGMSCTSDEENPWLAPTRHLIERTVAAGKPFLGICLGHQMATVALGGEVGRKEQCSIGLTPVGINDDGRGDALLSAVAEPAEAVQYNYDHVTRVPDGAVVLATAPDGHVQALRFADRAWGVQFHPECSPATFDEWTVDKPEDKQPADVTEVPLADLAAAITAAEPQLQKTWRPLALRFVDLVKENR